MDQAELTASQLDWSNFDGRSVAGVSILIDVDSTPRCLLASCRIHVQKHATLDLREIEGYAGCLIEGPGKVLYPKRPS